jgi:hypothetical protein
MLLILHSGSQVFNIFQKPGIHATGHDAPSDLPAHRVRITNFIKALEECPRPDVADVSMEEEEEEEATARATFRKGKRRMFQRNIIGGAYRRSDMMMNR